MLTPFKSLSLVLDMISSISVHICNFFMLVELIAVKWFREIPLFDAYLRRSP